MTRIPIEQADPPRSPKLTLPTMYDLPSENLEEPGLPDEYHLWQAQLCSATFQPPNYPEDLVFVASDLNLYYNPQQTGWYKRPDWFGVVGIPRLYEGRDLRLSYVIWQEGVRPTVVMEFLSPSTRNEDLGQSKPKGQQPSKWQVYEQILGIPYYIVFDRYQDELMVFELQGGQYKQLTLTEPSIWLPNLELGLGLWQGEYHTLHRQWLRWYDAKGNPISLPEEAAMSRAEVAEQQLATTQEELAAAQTKAEQLAERLRQMGIDPDSL